MLIGGDWVDSASGKTFEVFNPATGEVLANVAEGDSEDIDRAVKTARAAFEHGPWSTMSPSERGRIIHRIGDLILEHGDELAALETLDNGKPMAIAQAPTYRSRPTTSTTTRAGPPRSAARRSSRRCRTCPTLEWHAYSLREPVGVVGQIIPWNFPLLMAAWKLGPALALRLHDRPQAGRADAAVGAAPRRADPRGRRARGRAQHRHRLRRDGRRRARRARGCRQDRVHGFDRSRQDDRPGRIGQPEEGDARARRQVAERRLRRRRHGDRDPRCGKRDLLQPRPVLCGRIAAVRRARFLRPGARGRRRPCRSRSRSARGSTRRPRWARSSRRSSTTASPGSSTPAARRARRRSPAATRSTAPATSSSRPCSPRRLRR